MNRLYVYVSLPFLLTSCASDIIDRGDGTYISHARSYITVEPESVIKARVVSNANSFCAERGKKAKVVEEGLSQGGIPMDRAAIANVIFECVSSAEK